MPEPIAPSAPANPASDGRGSPDGRDPLATLHKMSTTAGLGSQDYVAINPIAIVAVLLGLTSALVMINKIFAIIPAVGILCGIAAWVQIRRSSGTQTGLALAIVGILLSIALTAVAGVKDLSAYRQRAADRQEISALIDRFSSIVQSADENPDHWRDAYALFDQTFRQRETESSFVSRWKSLQNTLGAIKSFHWNHGNISFDTDPATADLTGTAMVVIEFKNTKNPEGRYPMLFRKVGSTWQVDDFPVLFPQQPPPGPGMPGAGGPGGPGAPGGFGGPPGH